MCYLYYIFLHKALRLKASLYIYTCSFLEMAISKWLLATINAVSFFSGKPDHFLAPRLSHTTRRIKTLLSWDVVKIWEAFYDAWGWDSNKEWQPRNWNLSFLKREELFDYRCNWFLAKGKKTLKTEFWNRVFFLLKIRKA